MKLKFFTVIALLCSFTLVNAQNTSLAKKEIQWKGLETWSTNEVSKKVISFEGAQYPGEHDLPYFVENIAKDNNSNYQFNIVNPTFQPISDEEKTFLSGINLPENVTVTTFPVIDRTNQQLIIQILPFVRKGDEVLKLKSFELETIRQNAPQKAPTSIHSYTNSSVLASGKFVKVKIRESGIYKVTFEALKSMGVDPANVRVFGYGGALLDQDFRKPKKDDLPEVAVWMEKGADGVFNAGDYILFYGQGITQWSYNKERMMFTHTLNHYSTDGYYFITSDAGIGKKIGDKTISVPENADVITVNEFVDYQVHEVEKYNIGKTGKAFYGEEFSSTLTYNFPFSFPNITNDDVVVRIDLAAASSVTSSFDLSLNNVTRRVSVAAMTDRFDVGKDANIKFTFPSGSAANQNFKLTYNKSNNNARGYLNYLEVSARRQLKMVGSVLFFRNVDNLNSQNYNKFQLTGANANVQIWDITDQNNIKRLVTTRAGDVIEFIDSNNGEVKEYVAIDPSAKSAFTLEPTVVGDVPNQNLHALPATDMLIITHPSFVSQSERLAKEHRERDNMVVNVVTSEQVYNEFSSGTPDASAYRWVMKMLYDRALSNGKPEELPRYLLLFGRGTFDNRGLIKESGDNLLLTYQTEVSLHLVDSWVSDDYFGMMDDAEGVNIPTDKLDIGIGRFPTVTQQHADDVVNKTIAYMDNTIKGNWKNQLTFIADDGDGSLHVKQADSIVRVLGVTNPEYQFQKIYLDSYPQEISASGESYPLAQKKLLSLVNTGSFMVNFTGHAGPQGWTNEQILSTKDVLEMYNKKLPIWIAATCDFVLFDVKNISAGEFVLLNPVGGGITMFSAARTVYAHQNSILNRFFCEELFTKKNGEYPRLGDACRIAKNRINLDKNKLPYVLLGDPALRLNYPEPYRVVTQKINGTSVQSNDTLKALSVNTIEGYVVDMAGNKDTDFNGTVEVSVYDKIQNITTLNNHGDKDGVSGIFKYQDRPNILYAGKAKVVDGEFSITFMMPKDIRYNYGGGRINYYVNDTITGKEGQGYYENFIVGGYSNNIQYETDGPIIQMYLNTPTFKSGDKVNETPLFVAHVSDASGINTVGSGIGHDLRLVIDDDPYSSYTLNENFESDHNSYNSGTVRLKLPKLSAGKHTLTFHAWDLQNNSSQSTFEFEVVHGLKPVIFNVRNYPNPVKTETNFVVEHDRPEVILETKVEIYDLAGRLIFTKEQKSADNLKWDLKDSSGGRVNPGMYLYKVSAKTSNSEFTSKANKIIVLAQ